MRFAVAVVALVALSPATFAQDVSPDIRKGIELYEDLEYDDAVAALVSALAAPEIDKPSKIEGYKYLALSYVALRKPNDARDAFRRLLEIDRKYQLERSESRTARDLLAEVRDAMPHELSIRQTPSPAIPRAGSPFKVDIKITDEDEMHRGVVLYHRKQGAEEFSAVQAAPLGQGQYTATVSGAFVEQPGLQYYVATTSGTGRVLASAGSADKPLSVVVTRAARIVSPGGSVFSSPWFWAGTGAVVVGGAAAAFFLLRSDDPPAPGAQINLVVEFE